MARPKLKLDRFLPYRLSVASNAISERISDVYRKRFGLKIPEWRLIAILAEHQQMTPQDIGKAGELDKIMVSRAASAMIDRGLVARSGNPSDGRSHFLSLTHEGRGLYEEIAPLALALEKQLFSVLYAEEVRVLENMLHRIHKSAMEEGS